MHHPFLFALVGGLIPFLVAYRAGRFLGWRRAAFGHGPHGCGMHGRWHGHGSHGGRPSSLSEGQRLRAAGEMLKRRLRVNADQQDIVDHALKDAYASLRELKAGWTDSRVGLAEAFAAEEVDEAALAAAFASQDADLARSRQDLASALKQVHAVLDEEQRQRLSKLLAQGLGRRR